MEFERLSSAIFALKPSERRYVPPLNLPVVPGFAFCEEGEDTVFYSLLSVPPLTFLWKPMLQFDPRMSYD
eukprot:1557287-Rhodomonas_salina.1